MKFLTALAILPVALGQVLPTNWPSSVYPPFAPLANLTITYPKHTISNANSGVFLPITDLQTEPILTLDPPLPGNFLYFMIDPDVAANWANILHAYRTDLTSNTNTGVIAGAAGSTGTTPYIGPGAPKGDPPHKYTFVVFQQPAGFRAPAGFNPATRIGFSLPKFVSDAKLGAPVAGQFLTTVTP